MARRKRFQRGWLLKIGKRRKVWVGRWREDVLLEEGKVGRVQRSLLLGTVAELPTRRDAQARLDEKLLAVNAGSSRPESSVTFGWFAEQQWTPLVFPTFKASTQHGYKAVLANHVLPAWKEWRLRDIERLAIQQWVAEKFAKKTGWQTVRNSWVLLSGILESAVEYGYLQTNPARGVKFPQKGLKEKPAIIEGESLVKLLDELGEPYRTMVQLIAATGLRIGELLALRWSALDLDIGTLAVRESVFEGRFQAPKTVRAMRTIPLGSHAVAVLSKHRDASCRREPNDLVFGNRKGEPFRESKMLDARAATGSGVGGLGTCDVASVPPHPFVSAQRPPGAGEDRTGAARTREHFHDVGHLHARRRRVTPGRSDRGRGALVRRNAPKCSEVGSSARKRYTRKWQC